MPQGVENETQHSIEGNHKEWFFSESFHYLFPPARKDLKSSDLTVASQNNLHLIQSPGKQQFSSSEVDSLKQKKHRKTGGGKKHIATSKWKTT